MGELDPVLAEARLRPHGAPRFYPPGQHPATRRWRDHLAALEAHRERLDALAGGALTFGEVAQYRRIAKECDEMIAHVLNHLALFEEGESIAKADYLRMVERRR